MRNVTLSQGLTALATALTFVAAGLAHAIGAGAVTQFALAGLALAAAAALIGQSIEAVGEHWGTGATSLLQSTLGNLPELFVCIFALRQGLTTVVQAALVGSVLSAVALVLGFAFLAGGLRHGTQQFDPREPRLNATLLLLAVAALLVPTLSHSLDTPAAPHAGALSNVCAVVLLVLYAASVPYSLALTRRRRPEPSEERDQETTPALGLTIAVLAVASAAAAFASNWFVEPLQEASTTLGISEAFTGLVIVAIASNAVEHVVGIRFALRAKPAYAVSTTLNSPLQVALLLVPVLVLVSGAVGPEKLTLVFPPLMVAALAVSALVVIAVVYDGEYTWLEGVALLGLYTILAASFWWG